MPARSNALTAVALSLTLGLALIGTGLQLTSKGGSEASAPIDGARILRQARWVPTLTKPDAAPLAAGSSVSVSSGGGGGAEGGERSTSVPEPVQVARSTVATAGSCLVTKWSAVWLVHADGKTRSHVASPTPACDLHATPADDIDQYAKAHGGVGAYSLSEQESVAACNRPGCNQRLGTDAGAPGAGKGALAPPHNGWGFGVAEGWQRRSSLKFNEPASTMFAAPPPPIGEPLLLVFGGASVTDMLRNWALHARELQMRYAVACMDAKLFNTANEQQARAPARTRHGPPSAPARVPLVLQCLRLPSCAKPRPVAS